MYDFASFSSGEALQCAAELRELGQGAKSMEEVARRIADYFYTSFIDSETGEPSAVAVRLSLTQDYDNLPPDLQACALTELGGQRKSGRLRCLVALGIRGQRPELNDRRNAGQYRAIPLVSEEAVKQIPMTGLLIKQLGLEINTVLAPDPSLLLDLSKHTYNVFYVADLTDFPFEPPPDDLALAEGAKSIVGFGGILPTGDLFSFILFSRQLIPRQAADLFEPLALSVKSVLLPFTGRVFDEPAS